MTRVLAQAIVDSILSPLDPRKARWMVTVVGGLQGAEPLDKQQRVYRLTAASDTLAAQEGIRLFVTEIEALST